jgi:hypothetical protein|tara:strand:- start:35 stop:832 length:798 start_codon:yes stop_codon:yes gene_type:complete
MLRLKQFLMMKEEKMLLNMSDPRVGLQEAGRTTERQENAFVELVNTSFKQNNEKPFDLITKEDTIKNVIKAEKFSGRQKSGSEPYTDVKIYTSTGVLNFSMKGPSAPSLAGGGLRGIEEIIPGIGARFFRAAYNNHKKKGLKVGDKVPDTYAILNDVDKKLLVIGNEAMGGPIEYMYIGPMDVKGSFKNGKLTINGKAIESNKYSDSKDLFFRLRARRVDQTFDPEASDKNGIPKIYGKSPSKGDSAGRLVVTDKPANSRGLITF